MKSNPWNWWMAAWTLLVLATGCTQATFTEPMPIDRRDLSAFPEGWRGVWVDKENQAYKVADHYFMPADSSELFILGHEMKLRRYRDFLVINRKQDDGTWEVILAKRRGNVVSLYGFNSDNEEAVAVWKEVLPDGISTTGVGEDSKKWILKPENNAAFRKLVRKGGITPLGEWVRRTE
ncbi:MAG: hypothetical protein RJA19_483 [Bacteroidota bacterium]|jgi:hypothetical protein